MQQVRQAWLVAQEQLELLGALEPLDIPEPLASQGSQDQGATLDRRDLSGHPVQLV